MDSGDVPELPARPQLPPKSPLAHETSAPITRPDRKLGELEEGPIPEVTFQVHRQEDDLQKVESALREANESLVKKQKENEQRWFADEQLLQSQLQQYNDANIIRLRELENELLALRGQYERDQLLLEQYDRVSSLVQVIA